MKLCPKYQSPWPSNFRQEDIFFPTCLCNKIDHRAGQVLTPGLLFEQIGPLVPEKKIFKEVLFLPYMGVASIFVT